jgi:hypothetical protein
VVLFDVDQEQAALAPGAIERRVPAALPVNVALTGIRHLSLRRERGVPNAKTVLHSRAVCEEAGVYSVHSIEDVGRPGRAD